MAIMFDGTYRLKPLDGGNIPIRKWTDAWRIRIIDLALTYSDIRYLRPRIVVAIQTGTKTLRTSCAESLGKRICRDFDLDARDILWVEQFPDDYKNFYVATFISGPHMGVGSHESVTWRPALPNELGAIKPYIPEMEPLDSHRNHPENDE